MSIKQGNISPRYNPIVISLDETQILIMGDRKQKYVYQSNIQLFDTNEKTVTTEVLNDDFEFTAPQNQCALTAPNQITAFV